MYYPDPGQPRPHAATSTDDGGSVTYDANVNMTSRRLSSSDPACTQTWDYETRLTQVTKPGLTATYVYDGAGPRVKSTTNGVTTARAGVGQLGHQN